jgi:hypothetical protein
MSWLFESTLVETLPEDCAGFVYLITNTVSGRKYIGKKLAKFSRTTVRTVKLKNGNKKKKKIRSKIDSDWLTYWSSSDELKADVAALGEANFKREILRYCNSKNELSYYEAKYQFEHGVIEKPDEYYNTWIMCRVHRKHLKL